MWRGVVCGACVRARARARVCVCVCVRVLAVRGEPVEVLGRVMDRVEPPEEADVGKRPGLKTVNVEVFDGSQVTVGTLVVDARRPSDVPPLANGDFYTTTVGTEIEVKPLLNDQGVNLSLMNIDPPVPEGPKLTADYLNRSFRFSAPLPGTYYVGYKVSSGPWSYGLVRIDVTEHATTNRPPVAQRDVALLTHNGSVTIDPLVNDEDPDGDVMVVQTYTTNPGLQIEMARRGLRPRFLAGRDRRVCS